MTVQFCQDLRSNNQDKHCIIKSPQGESQVLIQQVVSLRTLDNTNAVCRKQEERHRQGRHSSLQGIIQYKTLLTFLFGKILNTCFNFYFPKECLFRNQQNGFHHFINNKKSYQIWLLELIIQTPQVPITESRDIEKGISKQHCRWVILFIIFQHHRLLDLRLYFDNNAFKSTSFVHLSRK